MKERAALTAIWLGAFVASLLILESYVGRRNGEGMLMLLAEDRLEAMQPIATLYASYVAGVLAFWFLRPFAPGANERAASMRFYIALGCTILFNAVVLYLVGHYHLSGGGNVMDDVDTAQKSATMLSFVVAPVNAYYFGMKAAEK